MRAWTVWALVGAAAACGGDGGGGFAPLTGVPAALGSPLDVWAFSPTNVWIVDGSTMVHRFDGTSWSTLATPAKGGLTCIFALSQSDVWLCAGREVLHHDGAMFTASDVSAATGL